MPSMPRFSPAMALLCLLLVLLCRPLPAQGAETAKARGKKAQPLPVIFFDYSLASGQDELLVLADAPLGKHRFFRLENPPRLVLDIPGVTIQENMVGLPVNRPELSGIRIARHADKVRFVFDLTEQVPVTHKVEKVDKGLKIILRPKGEAGQRSPQRTEPGPAQDRAAEEGLLSPPHITSLFGEQRVTILFHKAPAREFFSFVAEKSKTRIVVSPEVRETISLRLNDVTLGEAVNAVVGHLDLALTRDKEEILVRPAQPGKRAGAGSI